MPKLTYIMGDKDLLAWQHNGKTYCLQTMQENDAISPIEDEEIVKLAFFGHKQFLGNDPETKNQHPDDYMANLVEKLVPAEHALQKILDMQLPGLLAAKYDGETIKITDINTKSNDTIETDTANLLHDIKDFLTETRSTILLKDFAYIMPVYAYEHSGISLKVGDRTYPYNDQWDSYQIGIAIVPKSSIINNTIGSEETWASMAKTCIENCIKNYNQYLSGDCYGYSLYEQDDSKPTIKWNEIETVWGYLGDDIIASGIADNAGNGLLDAIKNKTYMTGRIETRTIELFNINGKISMSADAGFDFA